MESSNQTSFLQLFLIEITFFEATKIIGFNVYSQSVHQIVRHVTNKLEDVKPVCQVYGGIPVMRPVLLNVKHVTNTLGSVKLVPMVFLG